MKLKYTSEMLMKDMGLNVGDRIKAPNGVIYEVVSEVIDSANVIGLINKGKYEDNYFPLKMLVCDEEFEILPRPKRVGELKCSEFDSCRTCPLQWLCFTKIDEKDDLQTSLYEMLESFKVKDQEIYDLLKARLDKEVEE